MWARTAAFRLTARHFLILSSSNGLETEEFLPLPTSIGSYRAFRAAHRGSRRLSTPTFYRVPTTVEQSDSYRRSAVAILSYDAHPQRGREPLGFALHGIGTNQNFPLEFCRLLLALLGTPRAAYGGLEAKRHVCPRFRVGY